jgi:hypothetical protein
MSVLYTCSIHPPERSLLLDAGSAGTLIHSSPTKKIQDVWGKSRLQEDRETIEVYRSRDSSCINNTVGGNFRKIKKRPQEMEEGRCQDYMDIADVERK